jgi:hypothetical protein
VFQAIALFNADQCEEAMLLVKELAVNCPNADTVACRVVEVSVIRLYLGINTDRTLGISTCSIWDQCLE